MIDAASLLEALWRRRFLYFQVGYILACSHNSVISFRFLSLLWPLIQTNTSSKEGGGSRLAFKQKKDQISEKNEQLKKRWSLSSGALLHRRHSWGACRPQERNRSQVGSMFHTIIQERKECFVMEPEDQTTLCQCTRWRGSFSWDQISEAEKVFLGSLELHLQFSTNTSHQPQKIK